MHAPAAGQGKGTTGVAPGARCAALLAWLLLVTAAVASPDGVEPAGLDRLIATVRGLAAAADTYEFLLRPNIPYIHDHYAPQRLLDERIDVVLIVNLRGDPLFWRRAAHERGRGFPDARAFLAELPPLQAPQAAGLPALATTAQLARGPALVVAMPIYGARTPARARGWLIAARYVEAGPGAHRTAAAPASSSRSDDGQAALAPSPVVARAQAGLADLAAALPRRSGAVFGVGGLLAAAAVTSALLLGQRRSALGVRSNQRRHGPASAPLQAASVESGGLFPVVADLPLAPAQASAALQKRLLAGGAVFCYQPQINLQDGRIAGITALLCIHGAHGYVAADALVAGLEGAGLGAALYERRLREACRRQRLWLQELGQDFPIAIPVTRHRLVDADSLSVLQRVLAELELRPAALELELETMLPTGDGIAPLHLGSACGVGISLAIDLESAMNFNPRLPAMVPVSKLRVDARLLLQGIDATPEGVRLQGILDVACSLGIDVCATGVDSPATPAALQRCGRFLAQGRAMGGPLDAEQFLQLLRNRNEVTASLPPLILGRA